MDTVAGRLRVTLATRTSVIEGAPLDAQRHLEELHGAIARAPRRSVALAPGELLVFSNTTSLHGRPPFRSERWLKRAYLRADLGWLDRVAATGTPAVYAAADAVS
jgi:alpha-ketoglutarate-dependent taurine dioxygenase